MENKELRGVIEEEDIPCTKAKNNPDYHLQKILERTEESDKNVGKA